MKPILKLLLTLAALLAAAFPGISSATFVSLKAVSVPGGFVTVNDEIGSGRAIFVSTFYTDIPGGAKAAFEPYFDNPTWTSAQFDEVLNTFIGPISIDSPGIVRTDPFTDGVLNTPFSRTEVGMNFSTVCLILVAESGGFVTGLGVYSGPRIVPNGPMIFNTSTAQDTAGVGTSENGFQLTPVPEPTIAILGLARAALAARRRRAQND